MSKPDCEDGYTRIANELFEQIISYPFSKRELLIVLALARKTYGYQKKFDTLSMFSIAKMTGIPRTHVGTAVAKLIHKGVIVDSGKPIILRGQEVRAIGINKDYSKWATVTESDTVTKPVTVTESVHDRNQNGTPTVTESVPTKENNKRKTKEREPLPENLNLEAWGKWEEYRKKRGLAKYVTNQKANALAKLPHDQQMACVDYSTENNYQGLFPERMTNAAGNRKSPLDRVREATGSAESFDLSEGDEGMGRAH